MKRAEDTDSERERDSSERSCSLLHQEWKRGRERQQWGVSSLHPKELSTFHLLWCTHFYSIPIQHVEEKGEERESSGRVSSLHTIRTFYSSSPVIYTFLFISHSYIWTKIVVNIFMPSKQKERELQTELFQPSSWKDLSRISWTSGKELNSS